MPERSPRMGKGSPHCEHENVSRVRPLYVDGRPLYKCDDCDIHFTYEDDEPTGKLIPLRRIPTGVVGTNDPSPNQEKD